MSIIAALLIGLVVGIIAKFIMPVRDGGGIILTSLLGVGGAMIATYLGQALGIYRAGEAAGFLGALVGAILILALYRAIARRRTI